MSRFAGFTFRSPKNYRGRNRYALPAVPARDLDKHDVAALDDDTYEAVKAAKMPDGKPLYEPIRSHKKADNAGDDGDDLVVASDAANDEVAVEDAGEAVSSAE